MKICAVILRPVWPLYSTCVKQLLLKQLILLLLLLLIFLTLSRSSQGGVKIKQKETWLLIAIFTNFIPLGVQFPRVKSKTNGPGMTIGPQRSQPQTSNRIEWHWINAVTQTCHNKKDSHFLTEKIGQLGGQEQESYLLALLHEIYKTNKF